MLKEIILVFGLLLSLSSESQKVKCSDLNNSYWFTSGNLDEFSMTDTIKLLKKSNSSLVRNTQINAEDLPDFYLGKDFISIYLKRRGGMDFSTTSSKKWIVKRRKGNFSWTFDNKINAIRFYFEKKLLGEFEIVGMDSVIVKSNFAGQPPFKSKEIILKRLVEK